MGYFDDKKNVDEYIKMADGYDGRELVEKLSNYLKPKSTVLELGMGPGKDLDILLEKYPTTGSDSSAVFLDLYRKKDLNADLLLLDAVTLETDLKFDCLYSNKVLHHLSTEDLRRSLKKQPALLNKNGVVFHTFWAGNGEEFYHGLRFIYYSIHDLLDMVPKEFTVLEVSLFKESKKNDSILLVMEKTGV